MCGIAGIFNLNKKRYPALGHHISVMNKLQAHRGPDGEGAWEHANGHVGLGHRRLSIIDISTGSQPMSDSENNWVVHNGEIFNYLELRQELKSSYNFKTVSDTEVILAAYKKWGADCVNHLRGMFSFAIWDESNQSLFCARDRFGIKPFYYTVVNNVFYFASEAKALLPFLPGIKTNVDALKDYLIFQLCLDGKTLFEGVHELLPAHRLIIKNKSIKPERYWEVYYNLDFHNNEKYFEDRLRSLLEDSIKFHLRSDVPIGVYLSGGTDSSIVALLASKLGDKKELRAFNGKFSKSEKYDESRYARMVAKKCGIKLHEEDIASGDFLDNIRKIIYYLDYPVGGPGSFPQYMVSKTAASHRKVVLGGQGGDEIFGGYVRYLIAYFEQCIKAAIGGTMHNGNFIVTYESIIPNLVALNNYKPLLQEFWQEGLFDDMDKRYYRLVNRASKMDSEINWDQLGGYSPFDTFSRLFNVSNVGKESYFDKMTHFDFKTLLPALLQVEDRMSMAHGLESRVPFLDHPLVEFAATIPSNIKFKNGTLKKVLINTMKDMLPDEISNRKNKMGFPVPLNEWLSSDLRDFVNDIFLQQKRKKRQFFNSEEIIKGLTKEAKFDRKIWGLLSLEIWNQEFCDKHAHYKRLIERRGSI